MYCSNLTPFFFSDNFTWKRSQSSSHMESHEKRTSSTDFWNKPQWLTIPFPTKHFKRFYNFVAFKELSFFPHPFFL